MSDELVEAVDRRLTDPVSELTRKERRALVATSAVGVFVAHTGVLPTDITTLGLHIASTQRRAVFLGLALVILYLLAGFVVYAGADGARWALAFYRSKREADLDRALWGWRVDLGLEYPPAEVPPPDDLPVREAVMERHKRPLRAPTWLASGSYVLRGIFEFCVPVWLASLAVASLLFTR